MKGADFLLKMNDITGMKNRHLIPSFVQWYLDHQCRSRTLSYIPTNFRRWVILIINHWFLKIGLPVDALLYCTLGGDYEERDALKVSWPVATHQKVK